MNRSVVAIICISLGLIACGTPERREDARDPAAGIRLEVPFYADQTNQCGPATLAGILAFWGKQTSPGDLRQEMFIDKLGGTLPMDMLVTAQHHGLQAQMVKGDLETLRTELQSGRPVLAMLDVGFSVAHLDHYVIVTGFD